MNAFVNTIADLHQSDASIQFITQGNQSIDLKSMLNSQALPQVTPKAIVSSEDPVKMMSPNDNH